MDNRAKDLNQISRLIFDRAARWWQYSIGLELIAGSISVWASLSANKPETSLFWTIVVFVALAAAYALRQSASGAHDTAETMRRQSVLSEALGWEIDQAELVDWRSEAGKSVLKAVTEYPRPDNYYDNDLGIGARKLASMTFESAHWTKCLYVFLRQYLVVALVLGIAGVLTLITVSAFSIVSQSQRVELALAAFLIAPVLIALDFLGLVLRLNRAISALKRLSVHLNQKARLSNPNVSSVMRLVSEYNCIVSAGIPMPNWIWKLHRSSISGSWSGSL